ncbi:hypothetical protein QAD02_021324 [Eretmocerus hayati]|uniref:Uncharacterized protein n=1 Tax=Eretmocerus hayati TaxID=131215 RepID=A0ACC2PRD9_9HYME|nr:hypothetical protein QAD02_021324 [Eretmocerus hayati]
MDSSSIKIEKLRDKDNWQQWRFVVRTVLEDDDDVFEVIEGTLARLDAAEANCEAKLKRFLKADKSARKLIVTTVEKKPLELIMSCTTAREMWLKLNSGLI